MATTATMSGLQFDALPYEEGRRWELLEGELIEVSSPTPLHQEVVSAILFALLRYLKESGTPGKAYPDVEYSLSDSSRLRPDVSLLLPEKAQALDRRRIPIPGAPDLAVEVISPTERSVESHAKVLAYLRNGTAEVWQFFPKTRTIQIHKAESASCVLNSRHKLTSDLLPGFETPVDSFFE
jgi:Uma2 family endonuclease